MDNPVECNGITRVNFRPAPGMQSDVVALIITDTKGKDHGFLINPEALNRFLLPAIGLAARWADEPDLELNTLIGPKSALPATRMTIEKGRTAQECAVNMFLGNVQLAFLIPLEHVIKSMSGLVKQIETEDPKH